MEDNGLLKVYQEAIARTFKWEPSDIITSVVLLEDERRHIKKVASVVKEVKDDGSRQHSVQVANASKSQEKSTPWDLMELSRTPATQAEVTAKGQGSVEMAQQENASTSQAAMNMLEQKVTDQEQQFSIQTEEEDLPQLSEQAQFLLTHGAWPDVPPGRRDWSAVPARNIRTPLGTMTWPPANWKQLSPDSRLWAMETLVAVREMAKVPVGNFPELPRRYYLDRYNFLSLPDMRERAPVYATDKALADGRGLRHRAIILSESAGMRSPEMAQDFSRWNQQPAESRWLDVGTDLKEATKDVPLLWNTPQGRQRLKKLKEYSIPLDESTSDQDSLADPATFATQPPRKKQKKE